MADLYPNNSKNITLGFKALTQLVEDYDIQVKLEVAAEYFIDKHFEFLIQNNDVLSFGSRRYVLIEMSFVSVSQNLEEVIFALVTRGYQPILAHPERYTYLINSMSFFNRIIELGCLMQINILSLVGYYGNNVQNWALKLLNGGFVHFLGTDMHHRQHLDLLTRHQYDKKLVKLVSNYPFQNHKLLL